MVRVIVKIPLLTGLILAVLVLASTLVVGVVNGDDTPAVKRANLICDAC
jgi:hypothetical protein